MPRKKPQRKKLPTPFVLKAIGVFFAILAISSLLGLLPGQTAHTVEVIAVWMAGTSSFNNISPLLSTIFRVLFGVLGLASIFVVYGIAKRMEAGWWVGTILLSLFTVAAVLTIIFLLVSNQAAFSVEVVAAILVGVIPFGINMILLHSMMAKNVKTLFNSSS